MIKVKMKRVYDCHILGLNPCSNCLYSGLPQFQRWADPLCLINRYNNEYLQNETNLGKMLKELVVRRILSYNKGMLGLSIPHFKAAVDTFKPEHSELLNKLLLLA